MESLHQLCSRSISVNACKNLSDNYLKYLANHLKEKIFHYFGPNSLFLMERNYPEYKEYTRDVWKKLALNLYSSYAMKINKGNYKSSFFSFFFEIILEESEINKDYNNQLIISLKKYQEIENASMIFTKSPLDQKILAKMLRFPKNFSKGTMMTNLLKNGQLDVLMEDKMFKSTDQYISINKLSDLYNENITEIYLNLLQIDQIKKFLKIIKKLKALKKIFFLNLRDDNFHYIPLLLTKHVELISFQHLILSKESQVKVLESLLYLPPNKKSSRRNTSSFANKIVKNDFLIQTNTKILSGTKIKLLKIKKKTKK
eukprot:TRINITY_DN5039_c0_g1_i1.p1 TRINITY_DN5039_c0_g1~~TRINITY_DN5039_c0_g1_i1.p1  ORF type:complete len:324 (-),score=69.18 TRINITY_DN5039_c0_g1_i1:175-1116(-)